MHRIDDPTAIAVLPTPAAAGTPGFFTKGSPVGAIPATVVTDDWANALQEEVAYVIEQAGLTLDKTSHTQLRAAIQAMFAAAQKSVILSSVTFNAGVANGNAVYWDSANSRFDKALANGTATQNAVGFADVTNSKVYCFGDAVLFSGLTPGSKYYLDGTTAGAITATAPTSNIVAVGIAKSATEVFVDIDSQPASSTVDNSVNDFRLTLTTGTPVTTADVTGATTIFACPYKGNRIALFDGSTWNMRTSAQFSLALGTLVSGKPYDVFCYDNAGTPTLEFLVWTNDTTRATALTYQDGVTVKTGAVTRRYLGTFYTTATTTTEDSATKRYLWNNDNRVHRAMQAVDTTNSWTYTTATIRQANGSTANQLNYIVGVAEDCISASLAVTVSNSTTGAKESIGIGVDSTSAFSGLPATIQTESSITGQIYQATAFYKGIPGVGRHFLSWNEYSVATGTSTWYGDNGGTLTQSGIIGEVKS